MFILDKIYIFFTHNCMTPSDIFLFSLSKILNFQICGLKLSGKIYLCVLTKTSHSTFYTGESDSVIQIRWISVWGKKSVSNSQVYAAIRTMGDWIKMYTQVKWWKKISTRAVFLTYLKNILLFLFLLLTIVFLF